MAGPVLARYREAAALAEEEVQHFPEALFGQIRRDLKGAAADAARLQHIAARPGKGAEIQDGKAAPAVFLDAGGRCEKRLAAGRVQQPEVLRVPAADRGLFPLRPIADGREQDLPAGIDPAVLVLRLLDPFETQVPEHVGQFLPGRSVVAAAENVKAELRHRVPGHGGKLPDALVPLPVLQVKDRGALPEIGIGQRDGALVFHRDVQMQDPGAPDLGPHPEAQPVPVPPVLRREIQICPGGAEVGVVPVRGGALRPAPGAQGRFHRKAVFTRGQRRKAARLRQGDLRLFSVQRSCRKHLFLPKLPLGGRRSFQGQGPMDVKALPKLCFKLFAHGCSPLSADIFRFHHRVKTFSFQFGKVLNFTLFL